MVILLEHQFVETHASQWPYLLAKACWRSGQAKAVSGLSDCTIVTGVDSTVRTMTKGNKPCWFNVMYTKYMCDYSLHCLIAPLDDWSLPGAMKLSLLSALFDLRSTNMFYSTVCTPVCIRRFFSVNIIVCAAIQRGGIYTPSRVKNRVPVGDYIANRGLADCVRWVRIHVIEVFFRTCVRRQVLDVLCSNCSMASE